MLQVQMLEEKDEPCFYWLQEINWVTDDKFKDQLRGCKRCFPSKVCPIMHCTPGLERIESVAVRAAGAVFTMERPHRHSHIIHKFNLSRLPFAEAPDYAEGFWTSAGRFVDRRFGLRIAMASGQFNRYRGDKEKYLNERKYDGDELFSEDLW